MIKKDNKDILPFLEKFRGKTNQISKQGIHHLINQTGLSSNADIQDQTKRPSAFRSSSRRNEEYQQIRVNLDSLIPSEPKNNITIIKAQKKVLEKVGRESQYVPSFVEPSKSVNAISNNKILLKGDNNMHGSTKQLVDKAVKEYTLNQQQVKREGQNSRYGEYLRQRGSLLKSKNNLDALKHFQFLNMVENKIKGLH